MTEPLPPDIAGVVASLRRGGASDEIRRLPRGTITFTSAGGEGAPSPCVDLCKQRVSAEEAGALLAACAADRRALGALLLGANGLGGGGAEVIAREIAAGAEVHTLYLGCNGIDGRGVEHLARSLAKARTVRGLWLKRNPLGDEGASALAELLESSPGVRTLDLTATGLGASGIAAIVRAVCHGGEVERIYLGGNTAGGEALAQAIAPLFGAASPVKELYLAVGTLGDLGAKSLAAALLSGGAPIERLDLGSQGVGPSGLARLAEGILAARSLVHLSLATAPSTSVFGAARANALDEAACRALAGAAAVHRSLVSLDVLGTGVLSKGALAFVDAASKNARMRDVRLPSFRVARRIRRRLRELLGTRGGPLPPHPDVQAITSVYR